MILGICGVANSGKDTLAQFIAQDRGFTLLSLADPLKRICQDVFGFSDDQLWGPSQSRNAPDPRYPRVQCAGCQSCEFRCDHYYGLTPRYALQRLGTEWGRDCYADIWVKYAMGLARKLLTDPDDGSVPFYSHKEGFNYKPLGPYGLPKGVIIPDVRHLNEIQGIKAAGGKIVKLTRHRSGLYGEAAQHTSEMGQAAIPGSEFDRIIENNGTLEELRAKASLLVDSLCP